MHAEQSGVDGVDPLNDDDNNDDDNNDDDNDDHDHNDYGDDDADCECTQSSMVLTGPTSFIINQPRTTALHHKLSSGSWWW